MPPSSTPITDAESTHRHAETIPDADTDDATLQDVLERVHDLEQGVDEQHNRIDDLETTNETLRETVAQKAERIDELEDYSTGSRNSCSSLRTQCVTTGPTACSWDELGCSSLGDAVLELTTTVSMDEIAALRDKQLTDHQSVKRDLARIRRQLNHVSQETGVDPLDAVPGDDKIAKAVQDGIATVVTGQVTATYDRAELVL